MGNYAIVSEVGNALVKMLRDNMIPDVIHNRDTILLCSPSEKGDAVLGLCLYNVEECKEYQETGMNNLSLSEQRYPSTCLSLYYMITAYSDGDVKFRASEEQKVLGRAMQVLLDHTLLHEETLEPVEKNDFLSISVNMISMDMEEKIRIWNAPNIPYRLSFFIKVSPVKLESEKTREIQRVRDVSFDMVEKR
ncbi:MAG: DUF4255 domain-containing protein [Acetivibrio sp.]